MYMTAGARVKNAVRRLFQRNKVAIATGLHLYPFRTEKLNPFAPMVLLYQVGA